MNQHEARQLLERLQVAIQKARSNTVEQWGRDADVMAVLPELDAGVLSEDAPLLQAVTRVLEKDRIGGMDLYNLFYMASKSPATGVAYIFRWQEEMPEPNMKWVMDLE